MAIGLGRMFGIRFLENFNRPYAAKTITEFWRRWHISLSTWFRDYLYIPLGGNRGSKSITYRNLIIVFMATGIWHGAQWTFLIWGLYHGAFVLIERVMLGRNANQMRQPWMRYLYCLPVVIVGWILFRATSLKQAWEITSHLIPRTLISLPQFSPEVVSLMSPLNLTGFGLGIFIFFMSGKTSFGLKLISDPIADRIQRTKYAYGLATLVLASAWTFTSNFSPFLYFQF